MISKDKKDAQKSFSLLGVSFELGISLAIPLVFFALLGIGVDRAMQTRPLFLILGTVVGIISATVITAKRVRAMIRQADEEYAARKKGEGM